MYPPVGVIAITGLLLRDMAISVQRQLCADSGLTCRHRARGGLGSKAPSEKLRDRTLGLAVLIILIRESQAVAVTDKPIPGQLANGGLASDNCLADRQSARLATIIH